MNNVRIIHRIDLAMELSYRKNYLQKLINTKLKVYFNINI
ncbi:MAG: hypothetical protein KatS3mg068_0506 [Candidatus Sericytochromatia bacterium]|nr:MAG: hypothetical protein KatS3mg068_0506 [Candidatus Sericytochromatia bacterium]